VSVARSPDPLTGPRAFSALKCKFICAAIVSRLQNGQIDDFVDIDTQTPQPAILIPQPQQTFAIMPPKGDKYSVILPTYNERQNLPVLVQMLSDVFTRE
jgi:hypothetical protein